MFFFKRKTAYELLISDWSSDVCASDLAAATLQQQHDATAGKTFDAVGLRRSERAGIVGMHDNQYPPEPGPAGGCNASGLGCWHAVSAAMRVDRLRACLDLQHCAPPAAARRGQSARRRRGYAGLCEGVGRCGAEERRVGRERVRTG